MLPAIAALAFISALTIAPAVIEVKPALLIPISPVTATPVTTFDPYQQGFEQKLKQLIC